MVEWLSTGGVDPGVVSVTLTTVVIAHDACTFSDACGYLKALRAEIGARGLKPRRLGFRGRAAAVGMGSVKALAFGIGIGVLDAAAEVAAE